MQSQPGHPTDRRPTAGRSSRRILPPGPRCPDEDSLPTSTPSGVTRTSWDAASSRAKRYLRSPSGGWLPGLNADLSQCADMPSNTGIASGCSAAAGSRPLRMSQSWTASSWMRWLTYSRAVIDPRRGCQQAQRQSLPLKLSSNRCNWRYFSAKVGSNASPNHRAYSMSASALAADIAALFDGALNPGGGAESPARPRVMLAIWRSARLVKCPATSRIVHASQAGLCRQLIFRHRAQAFMQFPRQLSNDPDFAFDHRLIVGNHYSKTSRRIVLKFAATDSKGRQTSGPGCVAPRERWYRETERRGSGRRVWSRSSPGGCRGRANRFLHQPEPSVPVGVPESKPIP